MLGAIHFETGVYFNFLYYLSFTNSAMLFFCSSVFKHHWHLKKKEEGKNDIDIKEREQERTHPFAYLKFANLGYNKH